MLNPFVSTRPRIFGQPQVLLLSITAHVALIYAAFAPRPAMPFASGDVMRPRTPVLERIRFVEVAPQREAQKTIAPARKHDVTAAREHSDVVELPAMPRLRAPTIDRIAVADVPAVPDIDLSAAITQADSAIKPAAPVTDLVKSGLIVDPEKLAAHTGPYNKYDVDKAVVPNANNPKPVYPWQLQRQGMEASFIAQFVVDSTGRVDERSVQFLSTAHSLFLNAVRQALRRSRYQSAEVGGRRVNQLVEQRFTFLLVSGRGEYR